jgi:hypothetical protein
MTSIGAIDRKLSQLILTLDNKIVTYILYPFSSVFHPMMIWIPIITVYIMSGKSLYDVAIYVLGMLACLCCTTFLKRRLKRYKNYDSDQGQISLKKLVNLSASE